MKKVICPTCKQNMNDPPRDGYKNRDCRQCGQGLQKLRHRYNKATRAWAMRFQRVLNGEVTYGVYIGDSKQDLVDMKTENPKMENGKIVRVEIREVH